MDLKSYLDKHLGFVLKRRMLTLLLCLAVVLICCIKIGSLTNSQNFRDLFSEDNPELIAYDELDRTYANASSNTILIAIAPQSGNIFTRESLRVIEDLTQRAWLLPYAIRVDSLTNYSHSRADGDDLAIEPLVEESTTLTEDDLQRISSIALDTPEIKSRLVSEDGRVGGLRVSFAVPEDRSVAVGEINDSLELLIAEMKELQPDTGFYSVGEMVSDRALTRTTENELRVLIPLVLAVILIAAWLISRSFLCTLATLCLMIFTVSTAMGIAGWFGVVMTPISAYIPIVLMAFSVAYSIHIIMGVLAGLRRGLKKQEAIEYSIKENIYPIFLTSITTVIGFVSLNFSDLPPFRTLGTFVAIGVGFNFLFSITLLPALLASLPLQPPRFRALSVNLLTRLGEFVSRNHKFFLIVMSTIAILSAAGIWKIEFSDKLTEYYGERHEFRQNMEFVTANFTGVDVQEYSLDTREEGGITNPEYLAKIDKFAQWYRQQPGVHHVWSFADTMKRLNKNMNGDNPDYYRLPESQALAAQYLLLYELSLPFGKDLNNHINISKSATRMVVTLRNLSSREQRELAENGYAWLEANAPDLLSPPAGVSVMFTYLSERSVRSMLSGTAFAALIVSALLLMVFRSVRYGLVSLVPNFVPGLMAIGLWGYAIGNIGIASAIFAVISFGIVVDDTIHFMSRYIRASRQDGASPQHAIRFAFESTGTALMTTTIVLSLGFGVFMFSGFLPNWTLGALVTLSISLALVMDFLLLPSLLMLVDRGKNDRQAVKVDTEGPAK
ncbi:MAG: MMPL family transporter [Rhodobacteraceae bacterium]|nr:MMPL family transporter [Paracoccaceae bacterium]